MVSGGAETGKAPSSLIGLDLANRYSTSTDELLDDFYIPVLESSLTYDRAVGYFSSSLLALAPIAFSDFVARGGRIRLLCSPYLTPDDAEAVSELPGHLQPTPLAAAEQALRELANGTPTQILTAKCLSALIQSGTLELKFAVPKYGPGLFHDKIGAMLDGLGNSVCFTGSANETAAAWSGYINHEQITVFRSWEPNDSQRCVELRRDFDELWFGLRRGLTVTDAAESGHLVTKRIDPEPIDSVLAQIRTAAGRIGAEPSQIDLRDYQEEVLRNWDLAASKGIVAFATGGGKTRTALEGVRRWTSEGRPALILVPTRYLHEQWYRELREHLPSLPLLRVGAGATRAQWLSRLGDYTAAATELGPRVVLATYRSATQSAFLSNIRGGDHLLVVGDEVHSIGAHDTRQIMREVASGGRLGLSATPERFGDPAGTDSIFEYFGEILEPRFGISEALDRGVLVPYEYDFETCALTQAEDEEWASLTSQVGVMLARNKGEMNERIRLLLIRRARVIKRATAKSSLARRVLAQEYVAGDRWLVYCADIAHVREVRNELSELKIDLLEYHSETVDQEAQLDYFEARGGVLLAVKCLDEGVDIPLINKALILASSSNPREYIQRRGRVLRRSPGKFHARVIDAMVLDSSGLPVMPTEIKRAMEFASHSLNDRPLLYLEELYRAAVAAGRIADGTDEIEEE
ncbi:MAG: DEAD/DEAH box helicase family protein [Micrococcales bacterium]|nr:DEAD/DEAH box helicase family protein [Micrococcales bacterium]